MPPYIIKNVLTELCVMQDEAAWYGIDWSGPLPYQSDNDNCVEVPCTLCPLDDPSLAELFLTIPPLTQSDHWGIDVYLNTLTFVHQKLSINYSQS